ncbi:MAG: hypothetical protein HY787_26715 [Deltaproteobacteria bacterium]|nr:hypothetical protein [Deltaproteobacteria bacterium]
MKPINDIAEIQGKVSERINQERVKFESNSGLIQSNGRKFQTNKPDNQPTPAQKGFNSQFVLSCLVDNEDGDARLYIELNRGKKVYDHSAGVWFIYNQHYWQEDLVEEVLRAVTEVIDIYGVEYQRQSWEYLKAQKKDDEAKAKKHSKNMATLSKRIHDLQTVKRKKDILTLARSGQRSLGITGEEWDRDPMVLGCLNGVVNLKNGSFRPGKPKDYIKKIAPTSWRGLKEPAPQWGSFLNSIFNGHVELITFIQKLFGYAITGKTSEHVFPIFWGQGRNGKSTLFETLASVLGPLTGSMEAEIILKQAFNKNPGAPSPEIMALRGKRLVWFSESNEGRRIDAGKLKLLSGGDTLTGRDPYARRQVNFRPTHKIFLLTNNRPKVDTSDYALWARLSLIPFTLAFVPEPDPTKPNERRSDKDLPEKLKAESSGILAWAVQGSLSWIRDGLNPPEIVKAAIQEYREEEDLITHFIKETCKIGPDYKVKAGELYKAYQQWSSQMGLNPMNATRFGKELKKRFDYDDTSNYVFYKGIGLLDTSDSF